MEHADARWLEWSLPALAWVGGSLDAISYLSLGHVFTANMTGNTVLLAMALSSLDMARAMRSALAVLGFATGVAIGTGLLRGQATGWNVRVNRVLLLEAVLLGVAVFVFASAGRAPLLSPWVNGLIVLLGSVMGMQSAAVRQVHMAGVWTTFITGTLTEWVAGLVEHAPPKRSPLARVQITRLCHLQLGCRRCRLVAAAVAAMGDSAAVGGAAVRSGRRRAADAARRLGLQSA